MPKLNPRRVPVSKADLERAKNQARDEAVKYAWAIIFTVLQDKEGYEAEGLQRIWDEVDYLSKSVADGYVNITDLIYTMKEEYGVILH